MNSNRRSFIRLGSLALGASCLLRPRTLFALGAEKGVLSFDAAEMRLLDFAASYGPVARVIGASVLAGCARVAAACVCSCRCAILS